MPFILALLKEKSMSIPKQYSKEPNEKTGDFIANPKVFAEYEVRVTTGHCPNCGPERVAQVLLFNIFKKEFLAYWVHIYLNKFYKSNLSDKYVIYKLYWLRLKGKLGTKKALQEKNANAEHSVRPSSRDNICP
ncbi:hypothetical protein H8356DRAFT_1324880 [Neocallimastix lanati (nom. inval.)]|nr:hypothetical protein H8356DRAFT_1324880 [Neocallimastix sp. JGI-2020a]